VNFAPVHSQKEFVVDDARGVMMPNDRALSLLTVCGSHRVNWFWIRDVDSGEVGIRAAQRLKWRSLSTFRLWIAFGQFRPSAIGLGPGCAPSGPDRVRPVRPGIARRAVQRAQPP